MVSLLFQSRGLRKEEYKEKKRKREKRNEIQCMILLKSLIFGFTKSEICSEKDFYQTLIKVLKQYNDNSMRLNGMKSKVKNKETIT